MGAGPPPSSPRSAPWRIFLAVACRPRISAATVFSLTFHPARAGELAAFFGCLYYAALSPEEAVALRLADCHLPGSGRGMLRLASAAPRTAAAWTSDGTSYEQRGLKHRPEGAIGMVPVPPVSRQCSAVARSRALRTWSLARAARSGRSSSGTTPAHAAYSGRVVMAVTCRYLAR